MCEGLYCGSKLYDLPLESLIRVNCCSQERVGGFNQSNLGAAHEEKRIRVIVLLLHSVMDEANFPPLLSFFLPFHHALA